MRKLTRFRKKCYRHRHDKDWQYLAVTGVVKSAPKNMNESLMMHHRKYLLKTDILGLRTKAMINHLMKERRKSLKAGKYP